MANLYLTEQGSILRKKGDRLIVEKEKEVHLDVTGENIGIPLGLGSRHRAAAGITSLTDALAIVVSEETGGVRLFHHGKIFTEIEKGE